MRRLSVRRAGEGRGLAPVLAGLSLGFTAGFLLRGVVGGVDRRRLETLHQEMTGAYPERPAARAATDAVRSALAGDAALHGLALEVLPVSAGHVELHGWVPSRALRARAFRVALAVRPGLDVTNRLSVRGEDDVAATPGPEAQQPA